MIYILFALVVAAVIFFAACYVCYALAFKVPKKNKEIRFEFPDDEQYSPYKQTSHELFKKVCALPFEEISVSSFDGKTLRAKLYGEANSNAPVQIMFHGYKSIAERDFAGGLKLALDSGFRVISVDQRAHGKSGGRCLTFGVLERLDCLAWAEYAAKRFGEATPLLLYGISMGAATVLSATDLNLPANVAGVIADCGYDSPESIIKKVLRDKKLPLFPFYNLVRAGGMIFGGFDLESSSAEKSLLKCNIPVLIIHGGDDRFVPCHMSKTNFAACNCENKKLLIVDDAGHGVSFFADHSAYLAALNEFLASVLPNGNYSFKNVL